MPRTSLFLVLALAACGGDQKVGVYNTPPVVAITSPADGSSFDEATQVDFTGLVSDGTTAPTDLLLAWSSDVDGTLADTLTADSSGVTIFTSASLSVGNHTITLTATDPQGQQSLAAIGVVVNDVPDNPTINVVHPAAGESGVEGDSFEFVVQVGDEQQALDTLLTDFSSDIDGSFCTPMPDSLGVARCDATLSAGDHHLSFTVTDAEGLTAVAEYYFTVTSGSVIDDDGDGWTEVQGDCNDGDASVNPVATEYYNGRDDDCDGLVDDGTAGYDDDADGQTELEGDCDDTDPTTYLGATESYDAQDNDCDGTIDETTVGYDDDGDGLAELAGDCNDASSVVYPGAPELADGADNDCDGTVDEGTTNYDDDGDGYSEVMGDCNDAVAAVRPGATETCNGFDDDCNGTSDDEGASGSTTYYYDGDGDLYGSSSVAARNLCAPSGYYTATTNTDCYDYNASANPGASSYFTASRGDGSYDYDCNGSQTQYYTLTAGCRWTGTSCDVSQTGWNASIPSCGTTAGWSTTSNNDGCSQGCSNPFSGCFYRCDVTPTTTQTQACK